MVQKSPSHIATAEYWDARNRRSKSGLLSDIRGACNGMISEEKTPEEGEVRPT